MASKISPPARDEEGQQPDAPLASTKPSPLGNSDGQIPLDEQTPQHTALAPPRRRLLSVLALAALVIAWISILNPIFLFMVFLLRTPTSSQKFFQYLPLSVFCSVLEAGVFGLVARLLKRAMLVPEDLYHRKNRLAWFLGPAWVVAVTIVLVQARLLVECISY
ncbi:hypothetical protein LTR97_002327 [Elasticomyces elasticus]|uniref:Uncharacterized protein n=1 Tax=Elasticomyces elasticus TaxID=574655 RepID=A0AAN7WAI7_9PEZI|nr:hypothetical protein LTR97_002327 [Elasticomyces elasticus]